MFKTLNDWYLVISDQIGSNYGTNKIASTQQNPMLSRQLSVSIISRISISTH